MVYLSPDKLAELHQQILEEEGLVSACTEVSYLCRCIVSDVWCLIVQVENRLLDFHLSNLEFACGASLNRVSYLSTIVDIADPAYFLIQVSSFNWDHNDNFPQFSGCHALLPAGYMSVLSRLAEGFDVQLDSVVKHVELVKRDGSSYTSVKVTDTRGNEFTADKVCCLASLLCTHLHNVTT